MDSSVRKHSCLLYVICLFTACSRQAPQNGLLIAVSIPPQAWFVSQIAGNKAQTLVLVAPGQNPHNYEPSPRQIQGLATAQTWILSGAEFEISLRSKAEALFPNLPIIDGTEGIRFRKLEEHHDDEEEHAPSSEIADLEIDRHSWLGREPAKILAAHIRDALCAVDDANEKYYRAQCEELINLIDEEFDKLKIDLSAFNGKSVFVYHPSFGYFLDEFNIRQLAVEEGGKEPSPRELSNLTARLKEEQASAIFVQAQFPVNAARTLASAIGIELIVLDPLAQDWLENIRLMGKLLRSSLEETP